MIPCIYVRAGDRDTRREAAIRAPGAAPPPLRPPPPPPPPPPRPPPPRILWTVVVSHVTTAVREASCVPKACGSPATRCTARPAAAAPPADWEQRHGRREGRRKGRREGRRQAVQTVLRTTQCTTQCTTHAVHDACSARRMQCTRSAHAHRKPCSLLCACEERIGGAPRHDRQDQRVARDACEAVRP